MCTTRGEILNTKLSRGLIATLLIISAMLVIPSTTSQPAGIEGIGSGGCNCHGPSPDSRVSVVLDGVPESYNYSETYNLTVSFSGGPTSPENMN